MSNTKTVQDKILYKNMMKSHSQKIRDGKSDKNLTNNSEKVKTLKEKTPNTSKINQSAFNSKR